MATIGLSKVFILDKYFTELQKFWETERKVQGIERLCCPRLSCTRLYLNTVTFDGLLTGSNLRIPNRTTAREAVESAGENEMSASFA